MSSEADPDLPGDENFRAVREGVEVTPDGRMKMKDAISAEGQAAIHHNRLRYAELQKARLGLANDYGRTRYRHG